MSLSLPYTRGMHSSVQSPLRVCTFCDMIYWFAIAARIRRSTDQASQEEA